MEVLCANDGILSNAEVLQLIHERGESRPKDSPTQQGRQVLEKQLEGYLSTLDTSCVCRNAASFISACRSSNIELTKAEYLQLFNLLPSSVVEIHLIVEECSERLSEEQVDFIVELINSKFSAHSS